MIIRASGFAIVRLQANAGLWRVQTYFARAKKGSSGTHWQSRSTELATI
jgi:hypothetical protein